MLTWTEEIHEIMVRATYKTLTEASLVGWELTRLRSCMGVPVATVLTSLSFLQFASFVRELEPAADSDLAMWLTPMEQLVEKVRNVGTLDPIRWVALGHVCGALKTLMIPLVERSLAERQAASPKSTTAPEPQPHWQDSPVKIGPASAGEAREQVRLAREARFPLFGADMVGRSGSPLGGKPVFTREQLRVSADDSGQSAGGPAGGPVGAGELDGRRFQRMVTQAFAAKFFPMVVHGAVGRPLAVVMGCMSATTLVAVLANLLDVTLEPVQRGFVRELGPGSEFWTELGKLEAFAEELPADVGTWNAVQLGTLRRLLAVLLDTAATVLLDERR